ncbi:hypothetical protein BDZ89DRAFT_1077642 [Hymenopellis radicata]|nr:hypothetical protein BDZ89DRAFT_1077642 [Hymenopellis radicata]
MAANASFPSILSWTPPPAPSQNLKVLLAYVNARNKLDLSNVLRFFHTELEHRYLPMSLGRPVLTKKQYGEYLEALTSMMTTFTVSSQL